MPVPSTIIPTNAGTNDVENVTIPAPATMIAKLAMPTSSLPNRSLRLPPGILMSEP